MKTILVFLVLSLSFFSSTHDGLTDEEKESLQENLLENEEGIKQLSVLMRQRKNDNCKTDHQAYIEYKQKRTDFGAACLASQDPDVVRAREELADKQKAVNTIINNLRNTQSYRENLELYQKAIERTETKFNDLDKKEMRLESGKKVSICSSLRSRTRAEVIQRRGPLYSDMGSTRRYYTSSLNMSDTICFHLSGDEENYQCRTVARKCNEVMLERASADDFWKRTYHNSRFMVT